MEGGRETEDEATIDTHQEIEACTYMYSHQEIPHCDRYQDHSYSRRESMDEEREEPCHTDMYTHKTVQKLHLHSPRSEHICNTCMQGAYTISMDSLYHTAGKIVVPCHKILNMI